MKTRALIPIRAGSKGIPNKNMKEMCGKPLCYWVIDAALGAKSVDEVWVSTDYDEDIVGHIEPCLGARVLYRPAWLATDTATSDDVLRHFCWSECEPDDVVVMLQATSPLTTSNDIDGAVELLRECKSVVSVVETRRLFWTVNGPGYRPEKRPFRNEADPLYIENGAVYVSGARRILDGGARVDIRARPYKMHPDTLTEIDTPEDWDIVEKLLEARLS